MVVVRATLRDQQKVLSVLLVDVWSFWNILDDAPLDGLFF